MRIVDFYGICIKHIQGDRREMDGSQMNSNQLLFDKNLLFSMKLWIV